MESRVLRAVLADGRTVDFVLDQPVVTVGRSEENAIHLDDLSVSRRHARLSLEGDELYVEDLGSGAGTHLGGQQLTPRTRYLVRTGDRLRFGDVEASWLAPDAPAPEPEAGPSTAPVVPAVAASAVAAGVVAASLAVAAGTAEAAAAGVPEPAALGAVEPPPVAETLEPAEPPPAANVAQAPPIVPPPPPPPPTVTAEQLPPLEPPPLPAPPLVVATPPPPTSAIRLNIVLPAQAVEAGRVANGTVAVSNRGQLVDEVELRAEGEGGAWVTLGTQQLSLMPGAHQELPIQVRPPREPGATAGMHAFEIVGRSTATGAEERAAGSFSILPFSALTATITPAQGEKEFSVALHNAGNAAVAAALSATDDEAALQFEFGQMNVTVPAGGEQRVRLRARPGERPWTGPQAMKPFSVTVRPEQGALPPALAAQLVIKPRLGSPRRLVALLALLLVGVVGVLAFFLWPSDGKTPPAATATPSVTATATATPTPLPVNQAEAPYAGVHLCAPTDPGPPQAPPAGALRAVPAILASFQHIEGADPTAPLYAQNDSRWASHEYARASDNEFRSQNQCGSTIAQCGCAMTSVATIMSLFGLVVMPGGQALTPDELNTWLDAGATRTARGWVSRGYIYGDVVWAAVNQLSGEIARAHPGTPTVRFVSTGSGSEEQIRSELAQGRPIILEVPGHWIAAVGIDPDTNKILINDPYYADRKTLDVYAGKVKSSVLFERSGDLSAVVITAPSDLRIKVTDSQGHVVGTFDKGSPVDAQSKALLGIPGASYNFRQTWRDPNCIEKAPPPGAGTNQIVLPAPRDGTYTVEVLNPGGGPTNVTVHTYDKDGNLTLTTQDKGKFDVVVNSVTPTPTPTSTGTATPTAPRAATATATATATPTPAPTDTPTPTATPTNSPTPTPTRGPSAPDVVAIQCSYKVSQASSTTLADITITCTGTVQGNYDYTAFYQDKQLLANFVNTTKLTLPARTALPYTTVVEFRACFKNACASAFSTITVSAGG